MADGTPLSRDWPVDEPDRLRHTTLSRLQREVFRARNKHPEARLMLAALMEEVGELAKGIYEGHDIELIREEAFHVAVVALRIVEEGGI